MRRYWLLYCLRTPTPDTDTQNNAITFGFLQLLFDATGLHLT